ncbi:MAG: dTDP-4-dehydrorhamnose 3,5-epimerase family protein [Pirellulaceae bacterium]
MTEKALPGVYEIHGSPYRDDRGSLLRAYDATDFQQHGISVNWVQQSISYTAKQHTVRGLHTQRSPLLETKLITVVAGTMFWVVTDVRPGSPTFGKWEGTVLSTDGIQSLFIPGGFLHGCLSLTDNCYLVLNTNNRFCEELGVGVRWDDQQLNIRWPAPHTQFIGGDTHREYLSFRDFHEQYGAAR